MKAIDNTLAAGSAADTTDTSLVAAASIKDTTKIATPEGEMDRNSSPKKHPFFTIALVSQQHPGEALVSEENRDQGPAMARTRRRGAFHSGDIQFLWGAKPRIYEGGRKYFALYPVKSTPELTGGVIVNAKATLDPGFNQPIVTMEMNSDGSREWARITGANVNKRIAIVMDNAVFSAPVVRGRSPAAIPRLREWTTSTRPGCWKSC